MTTERQERLKQHALAILLVAALLVGVAILGAALSHLVLWVF